MIPPLKVPIQFSPDFAGNLKQIETNNKISIKKDNLNSIAGIENHCIRGLWKTVRIDPGEKVENKCLWNVINLENSWRFVQPSFTPAKHFSK